MAFRLLKDSVVELVILAMIVALALIMLGPDQGLASTVTAGSMEYNSTMDAVNQIGGISDWYGIIILAIVFLGIIGLMFAIYDMSKGQNGPAKK
jgi:hypothetical protein